MLEYLPLWKSERKKDLIKDEEDLRVVLDGLVWTNVKESEMIFRATEG